VEEEKLFWGEETDEEIGREMEGKEAKEVERVWSPVR